MKKQDYNVKFDEKEVEEVIQSDIVDLADNIKKKRKEKKLSQKELADKSKISLSTLIKIENGAHKNVTFNQIRRLSIALDVPISEVIRVEFYEEKMEAINKFMYYYPLLKQYDLLSIFSATMVVSDINSLGYLERRLEQLYESFPPDIKAFVELELLSSRSFNVYKKIMNNIIPEPYDSIISIDDYHRLESRYKSLLRYKIQQFYIINPVDYLENGNRSIVEI